MTLASRVARLVADGTDPSHVLLVTFSRRAAGELARRAGRLLHQSLRLPANSPPPELPWCGTFHSVAARLLRHWAPAIGLAGDFTVIDRADAEELLSQTRTQLGLHRSDNRFPLAATCLAMLSRAVNSASPLPELLASRYPWCRDHEQSLTQLFAAYTTAKQQQRLLDFDDLLLYWQLAMQHEPLARDARSRFDHVLVDEYQDTNRLQAEIVRALCPDGQGLTVVGDDAQSIYSFRAADPEQMQRFATSFSPPARVLVLEHNYRSTQPILAAANAVIAQAPHRLAKTLWSDRASAHKPQLVRVGDDAAQATWVADELLRERECGTPLVRQAVLFRTSHHSAALELELTRRGIPFVKYGGLRFIEAAHVKDTLALLRWTTNPRCRLAASRVVRMVSGIGPAAALDLADTMDAAADPAAALAGWVPPRRAATDWQGLREAWQRLAAGGCAWPADIDLAVHWVAAQLPRRYDDAPARAADLEQLARIARGYASRERFLTELTLDPPEASGNEAGVPHRDEDYLVLSTIHSAKGQEWTAVHVLNVVDGCIPSDMATGSAADIDEERRLLYVAMTRARERLHLLMPQRFHVTHQRSLGSRHLYALRSRFLPQELDVLFDHPVGPEPAALEAAAAPSPQPPAVDLAALARRRWQD